MNWIGQNLWLIPALPLLAAGVSAVVKRRHRTFSATLAIGSMVLAFFLSCAAFVATLGWIGEAARRVHNFDWFVLGETTLRLGWVLDPLTAAMLVMVTFVGLLIFIYSIGYMAQDENFTRFFCFLSLFAAAMLGVVIANSLLLLFICWELVGFASYMLIGFWYHKPSAAAAAKKAFITTRIGDVFFFLGLLWLYAETGTLLFYDGGQGCLEQSALTKLIGQTTLGGMAVSTAVSLLIFCGAIGKSGQVPLHVWLPDAMEGPTPVSALIHAATMVAAGVFLVARVYPLMAASPPKPIAVEMTGPTSSATAVRAEQTLTPALSLSERAREKSGSTAGEAKGGAPATASESAKARTMLSPLPGGEGERSHHSPPLSTALSAVTWIGAITAVFAALIAVAQTDIKRILAYSTVSQLGYMMLGLGVGGVAVGMFHLLTHAFFKALLFLGAGSVIHGCHEEQDIRRMGGLRRFMPITFATYAIGMMALTGVPLFFSGFWSKDEILHAAWLWQPSKWPFLLGCVGAFLTAFYMTRQMWFVFFGQPRTGVPPAPVPTHRPESSENVALQQPQPTVSTAHLEEHPGQTGPLSYVPHESPPVMTIPLAVLAVCTVVLSAFATPVFPWLQDYLSGETARLRTSVEVGVLLTILASTFIVATGLGLGWWLYRHQPLSPDEPDALEKLKPDWFAVLRGKFFIDELYEISFVRWNAWCARAARWLDENVWATAVMAVSLLVLGLSWLNRLIDEFVVNLGFNRGCDGLRLGARLLSLWQNGQVQRYLRVIGLGLVVFALVFIWGCRK